MGLAVALQSIECFGTVLLRVAVVIELLAVAVVVVVVAAVAVAAAAVVVEPAEPVAGNSIVPCIAASTQD